MRSETINHRVSCQSANEAGTAAMMATRVTGALGTCTTLQIGLELEVELQLYLFDHARTALWHALPAVVVLQHCQ